MREMMLKLKPPQVSPKLLKTAEDGLLYGFVFAPNQAPQEVNLSQAIVWLDDFAQNEQEGFLWLHFNLSNANSVKWMRKHLQLDEGFYELLNESESSTHVEMADNQLLAIVNDVNFDYNYDPSDISSLYLSANHHMLISTRLKPLKSVDELRYSVKQGVDFASPIELLAELFRYQAGTLVSLMRDISQKVNVIEDDFLIARFQNKKRIELGSYRRILIRFGRLLAPEPAALFRLINKPPAWVRESDILELRQATEEFSSTLHDIAGLQDRIKLLQEEMAIVISEQTNRSLYVLTVISVLALPVNMMAGLFGMNVGGIPFSENPHGFAWVSWAALLIVGVIAWLVFTRNKL